MKASWTTTELLGAEEMSKMAYDLLLKEDQMPKVKEIEEAIRKNTLYNKATIYYSENEQVADGNNKRANNRFQYQGFTNWRSSS